MTYEIFAAAWPSRTGELADRLNSIAKVVVSTTLDEVAWNNSRLLTGEVADDVSRLKQQPGQDILIVGSAELVHSLRHHDLIDEYQLMVHPVVLGSGKRLFRDGSDTPALRLVDTKTFSSGVVALTYQPAQPA